MSSFLPKSESRSAAALQLRTRAIVATRVVIHSPFEDDPFVSELGSWLGEDLKPSKELADSQNSGTYC